MGRIRESPRHRPRPSGVDQIAAKRDRTHRFKRRGLFYWPLVRRGRIRRVGTMTRRKSVGRQQEDCLSRWMIKIRSHAQRSQGAGSGAAGVQFLFSTSAVKNESLSFDHRASGTASRWAQVDYTLDAGINWLTGFWNNSGGIISPRFFLHL